VPCLVGPKLGEPTLPFPLSATAPSIPSFNFNPKLCCNFIQIKTPPLTVALPPGVLNPAVVATIRAGIRTVRNWVNSFQLPCPRDP